jgi:GntR family transcriptional regulator
VGGPAPEGGAVVIVEVDPSSPTPPYEQLRLQIARLIGAGELSTGDRLPTIRQLAGDLALAPGTIARVYRELELAGLIASHRRRGTFVTTAEAGTAAGPEPLARAERARRLTEAARQYAGVVRSLGIDPGAALEQARTALAAPDPGLGRQHTGGP